MRDGFSDLVGVGHVQRQRQDRLAVAFSKIGDSRQRAGRRSDLVTSLECGLDPNATKAAGCTGDGTRLYQTCDIPRIAKRSAASLWNG